MAFYGVPLEVKVRELNLQFKLQLSTRPKQQGQVRSLRKIFQQFDRNGNQKLDAFEFEQALANFGYAFPFSNSQ